MTTFQFLLLILAVVVFYLFFKQLLSGEHPKRGVDFEADVPDERIGGISRPDKTFSKPIQIDEPNRLEQLLKLADEALEKEDYDEATKALDSASIVEENNPAIAQRRGAMYLKQEKFDAAKEQYEKLIEFDDSDDMAYGILANILHKKSLDELALKYHERAIALDDTYAPHYFNYANTLYENGKSKEALENYTKAYELDSQLDDAKEMIEKLKAL